MFKTTLIVLLNWVSLFSFFSNPIPKSEPYSSYDVVMTELKRREGFASQPYWDGDAWAIGYGLHFKNKADIPPYPISEQLATSLIKKELDVLQKYVDEQFPNHEKHQKWAIISLVYNLGATRVNQNLVFWEALKIQDMEVLGEHWIADFSTTTNHKRSRELEWALFTEYEQKVKRMHEENAAIVKSRYERNIDFSNMKK